jgi:phosphate acyltransferase
MRPRVAVDAMGGDHAPQAVVRGAVQALQTGIDFHLVLVGREDVIRAELDQCGPLPDDIDIVHAASVIDMDESPVEALRQKKDSSILVMAKMAAEKAVDAVISAGNTGAFAAAAQLRMGTLPGVSRSGIAVTLPSFSGPMVLCDVGANIQAKPHHLYQYALMSTLFSQKVHGIDAPRVGLVSIGEESRKGTEVVKQTHDLLKSDERIRFVGNVEGRDLFQGVCDVAVSDGFVGNILLKFIEGLSESLFQTISKEFQDEDPLARQKYDAALQRVWARHDYSEYGGAPLLGVNGTCIICHGRSGERAIRNAVRAACSFLRERYNEALAECLGQAPVAG